MQITVRKIFKNDTDKAGNKLVSKKYNKPYFKIDVYAEGSDDKLSAFANSTSDPIYNMQEGGKYHIAIEEKAVGDRVFKNFKLLTPQEIELEELRAIKATIDKQTSEKDASTSEKQDFDIDSF